MASLSVVIPAYNEEANIASAITNVHTVLQSIQGLDWEIIVVNDGSRDHTGQIAKRHAKKISRLKVVENRPNRGYGGALKAGFAQASKDFIVFVPSDNQFDFREVTKLISLQQDTDADIVSGIRPGGGADPFHRKVNRWLWNTLVRALFGYLATDVDCGFKLFRRSILDKLSIPSNGAMIDTELYAGARARNMKIVEVEVTHLPRTAGSSTGANLKVILKAFKELAVYWWQLRQELMVERGRAVFKWEIIAMLIILFVAGYVRLYNISAYMMFLGDEGRDVSIVRDIILGKNFPLIGPGTSIGNMYLGPLYYYMMVVPLWLFNFSPVGPAVQVAVIGVITLGLLWWIGRQWFGRIPALVISLLYALSPTVILLSRSSWNPNVMPFFALLAMYGVWKVWRFGYWRWLVISAVCMAFVLQSHYLGLLLAPTIALFTLLSFFKHRSSFAMHYVLLATSTFFLLMSPLLIFDLAPSHPWQNSKAMLAFFTDRQSTVSLKPYKAIPNLGPLAVQIVTSLLTARSPMLSTALTIFMAILLVIALVSKRNPDLFYCLVWFMTGLVGLGLYKQHIYDHYFGFLFPVVFLLLGFVIAFLSQHIIGKFLTGILAGYLVMIALQSSPLNTPPNYQLAHTKQIATLVINESQGQPFNFALIAKQNYDRSYRYFFETTSAQYIPASEGQTNQLFVVCEYADCQPIGNPQWEIASWGWAKIDKLWEFPWGVKVYRLVPNPDGKPM